MIDYDFKSREEEYFSYYLEELKQAGFVKDWGYEVNTFTLSEPVVNYYYKNVRGKTVVKSEHLLREASITADFSILWDKKAENIFYLNTEVPIKGSVRDIPFRVNTTVEEDGEQKFISYVEIKAYYEKNTSSSISFPYKQKWLYDKTGIYIQKIKPFSPKKSKRADTLFNLTFTPRKVINLEVYRRNTSKNRIGESKLNYDVKTLNEFLFNLKK